MMNVKYVFPLLILFFGVRAARFPDLDLKLLSAADEDVDDLILHAIGRTEECKTLLEAGASISARTEYGEYTPLLLATKNGNIELVQYLTEYGADVNVEVNGIVASRPLHYAAVRAYADIVKCLIKNGAEVNDEDENKQTALHWAIISNGYAKTEIVKYLVSHRANVQAENIWQETPLHSAADKGDIEIVKYLVNHGANVHAVNIWQETPLHSAASNGHTETVKFLVEHGANINVKDNSQHTPHYYANKNGHIDVINYLRGHGTHLNNHFIYN
ncbi:26S proteasome non-ATPase regulatory subunit 10-like isoform X5 [Contarinia nasturtii]|uniref:26S proteasome non-ATPase regulatory subunit 10-like isoform X5 n=1 Tax=Contarinia nasturtii TaxID=265458 RepID=UPI0012D3CF29|nr:26S proteasome non-ATPase regulatory subunit 10-like isoform X5 [Contarinia nasturtii]